MSEWEKETYQGLPFLFKVLWVFFTGFMLGVFFAIVASVFSAMNPAGFQARYGSTAALWPVYLSGGATGGLLAGLLLPSVRSRFGAVVTGVLGMMPFYVAGCIHFYGPVTTWGRGTFFGIIIASLVSGGLIGLKGWADYGSD